jgi:hypothetical protein
VKSDTQRRFGALALKSRSTRSGARVDCPSRIVVRRFLPRTAPWRREESFARELRALRRDGQSLLDELPETVADFAPFESHVDACRDRMEAVLLDAAPEFVTRLRGLDGYWDSKMDGIPRIGGPRFVDTYLSDLLAILDDAIAVVRK